jgi:transposase-like protein
MSAAPTSPSPFAGSEWFDPLEEAVRLRVRGFIQGLLQEELEAALGRGRYERAGAAKGHRHGCRPRQLVTTFGPLELSVPRARLHDAAGEREWKSALLPAYKRLSHRAEALIAQAYLAGMNTRRVRRALAGLFAGKVGKDVVSRAWQRTRSSFAAWQQRDLAGEDIVRLILDGTVVKVRLDKKATAISLLVALGIRRDGQKVVLAIRSMGGESEAAWRAILDDLAARHMAKPQLVIVDGGKGLEAALASLWDDVPVQRCTVHKERNLLAHAPKHLHDEIKADFNDMVHAKTAADVQTKHKAFLAKWRLRCRAVAVSLEEAGERLFTFLRYPPEQWRSPPTPSSGSTRNSNDASRPSACCPAPRPPPCCSGRSWHRVRSPSARSMAGRPSPNRRPHLTSPPDQTNHAQQEPRRPIPTNPATRPGDGI